MGQQGLSNINNYLFLIGLIYKFTTGIFQITIYACAFTTETKNYINEGGSSEDNGGNLTPPVAKELLHHISCITHLLLLASC